MRRPANTLHLYRPEHQQPPTTWRWAVSPVAGVSFVGGTTASSPNPKIAFATAGYYTVTLTATNANGSTAASSPTPLLVQVPCLSYCAANGGYTNNFVSSLWITSVRVSAAGGGAGVSNCFGQRGGRLHFSTLIRTCH
ncbi:MAG: PKD domain-containing protein [Hymenobacter sp.]